jgi:hypothetical protein
MSLSSSPATISKVKFYKKWAAKDADQSSQEYGEQMPANNSADATDYQLEQLQKLGDLKANGILTQAEFEAKKQQILSQ